jgi:hypothetical protein
MDALRRIEWTGIARELGDAWRLLKGKRKARCVITNHPYGWELRMSVDDEFIRSQSFGEQNHFSTPPKMSLMNVRTACGVLGSTAVGVNISRTTFRLHVDCFDWRRLLPAGRDHLLQSVRALGLCPAKIRCVRLARPRG